MENTYNFKIEIATTKEVDIQIDFGTHYFSLGEDYYRIDIRPHPNSKVPTIDELRVVLDEGLDTKIILREKEYDLPYGFKRFLAGSGPGKLITKEEFDAKLNAAIDHIDSSN